MSDSAGNLPRTKHCACHAKQPASPQRRSGQTTLTNCDCHAKQNRHAQSTAAAARSGICMHKVLPQARKHPHGGRSAHASLPRKTASACTKSAPAPVRAPKSSKYLKVSKCTCTLKRESKRLNVSESKLSELEYVCESLCL